MAKRKGTKLQTMTYKAQHRKRTIDQQELH